MMGLTIIVQAEWMKAVQPRRRHQSRVVSVMETSAGTIVNVVLGCAVEGIVQPAKYCLHRLSSMWQLTDSTSQMHKAVLTSTLQAAELEKDYRGRLPRRMTHGLRSTATRTAR